MSITPITNDVIQELEDLLKRAKEGRIAGFAYAYVGDDGTPTWNVAPGTANCHVLNAGVTVLQHEINETILAESTVQCDECGSDGSEGQTEEPSGEVVPIRAPEEEP